MEKTLVALTRLLIVFGRMVQGLVKYPLAWFVVFSMSVNVCSVLYILSILQKKEQKDEKNADELARVHQQKDSIVVMAITSERKAGVAKDCVINSKDREIQMLYKAQSK